MKIKFYLLTVLLPLLFSCSNDDNILNSSSESDSEYYEFYVAEALKSSGPPTSCTDSLKGYYTE